MKLTAHLSRSVIVSLACSIGAALIAAAPASAALAPFFSASGAVSLSQTGFASNSGAQTKQIVKPAGATVQAAFLFAAGVGGYVPQSTDITLDAQPVSFSDTPVNSNFGEVTRQTDVTSIVKPIIDAAPAGNVDQIVDEVNNTGSIDGEALVVIFNDPNVTNNSIALEYGTQNTGGETFNVGFAQPIDLSTASIQFAIGDAFSFQGPTSGPPDDQYSVIDVNGTPPDPSNPAAGPDPHRLTSSAGGQDDQVAGCDDNGCLMTVGGVGDNPSNPADPFALPSTCGASPPYSCDDELYTLGSPLVNNGDTSMSVFTVNPSNNDDIFYASFVFSGIAAVVGEGITLAPPTQTDALGTNATVNAHAQDSNGNPVANTTVTFKVTAGPNAGKTGTATTDSNGNASFTYSSTLAGTDTVQASFVDSSNHTLTSNNVSVTWQQRDQPISATGASVSATEGHSFSGPVATFKDPDTSAKASEYSASINWGDGSTSTGTITGTGGKFTVSGTHTYKQQGSHTVKVTIKDRDNASNTATTTSSATVADGPLHAHSARPQKTGLTISGTLVKFTDANPFAKTSDYTVTIKWGDGHKTTTTARHGSGHFFIKKGHTYKHAGSYRITIKIVDDGGSTATVSRTVTFALPKPPPKLPKFTG